MEKFQPVFDALAPILKTYEERLVCVTNNSDKYYLDTHHIMKNKQPLFFGAVQIKKNYVSYYLMPVYVFPDLLESMSEGLKKRMQGKSCFNFKKVDEELFQELGALTKAGFEKYHSEGYIN